MDVSQALNHINENNYDDDITVTDLAKGYFPAVTNNVLSSDGGTRDITVTILPLEQAPGGTMSTNTGLFVRNADENAVKVVVMQDDKEVASNTTNYN
ncbi:MAG: hypothetical protein AAGG75_02935 [Bacteroidota bacterium]